MDAGTARLRALIALTGGVVGALLVATLVARADVVPKREHRDEAERQQVLVDSSHPSSTKADVRVQAHLVHFASARLRSDSSPSLPPFVSPRNRWNEATARSAIRVGDLLAFRSLHGSADRPLIVTMPTCGPPGARVVLG